MGRNRSRKYKLRYEVLSVRDKSFEQHLYRLVRGSYSVCEAEAPTLVESCLSFLHKVSPSPREPLQVLVEVPEGRGILQKVRTESVTRLKIALSVVAEDDVELWLEQGVQAMQTARLIRLIEEADRARCTLPSTLLAALVPLSSRTVANRLTPMWKRLHLPVLGIKRSVESSMTRLAWVLRSHLQRRSMEGVQRSLLLSPTAHGRLLRQSTQMARRYVAGADSDALAAEFRASPQEIASVFEVIRSVEGNRTEEHHLAQLVDGDVAASVGEQLAGSTSVEGARSAFKAHLIRNHAFSPVRANLLVDALEEANVKHRACDREVGEVLYWAISDQEPAGKRRLDCEVVPVRLSYFDASTDVLPRGTVRDLKARRAQRLAVDARRQGGLLSLPDLAFLVGMGTSALQQAIARTDMFVPTRGRVADIGRGVTHRAEIVRLYVEGYTESDIVRRTHHTYESVGNYLTDFRRVMVLVDQGLEPAHIRKVTRLSRPVVDAYVELYRQLDTNENQWKLNLMRLAARQKKKVRSQR